MAQYKIKGSFAILMKISFFLSDELDKLNIDSFSHLDADKNFLDLYTYSDLSEEQLITCLDKLGYTPYSIEDEVDNGN